MQHPSIQALFAAQVARDPDAIALTGPDGVLRYADLDGRSDTLARSLAARGAGPGTPVAILMERSAELVVAALAVLKTGAYYVPLHTAHPPARLQRAVDGLDGPLLLADATTSARGLPERCRAVLVAEAMAEPAPDVTLPEAGGGDLAYVMFTSGSTGEPKGVAVSHRDALDLILQPAWDSGVYDRSLLIAPFAFGMSTFEIWVPLLHGRRIVLFPPGEIEPGVLGDVIAREEVTVAHLTAGLFRVVAQEAPAILAPLRQVMTGGDVISGAAVARVLETNPELVVRAMYGATETVLFTTHAVLTAPWTAAGVVGVGRPLAGKRVYLLDDRLRPVGAGDRGQVYVAGQGLARGYLGRPDLTAERFVADPFGPPGSRMYRTGDLGRLTADGDLELVGRADDQVKIRGFRVEPAEVEAVLAEHPAVADVAVVARGPQHDDRRLVAYLVLKPGEDPAGPREHAARLLAGYMVPEAFVELERLPLTPNGKVDRAALPGPGSGPAPGTAPAVVDDPTTAMVCAAFAEALAKPAVGPDEDFFALAGQSLQAIRIIIRIEQATGIRLPIETLYDNSTPALLAGRIEEHRAQEATAGAVAAL
ncbi:amino acid adenylation domain-containing protein [Actinoplanes sp. G11-F43]|uniref:amino acid adenylation domain-containing protein n=1 Tax=Actinoplanes sp. G11-F43 TaxID=3424130 RepID=UPI003D3280F3